MSAYSHVPVDLSVISSNDRRAVLSRDPAPGTARYRSHRDDRGAVPGLAAGLREVLRLAVSVSAERVSIGKNLRRVGKGKWRERAEAANDG